MDVYDVFTAARMRTLCSSDSDMFVDANVVFADIVGRAENVMCNDSVTVAYV